MRITLRSSGLAECAIACWTILLYLFIYLYLFSYFYFICLFHSPTTVSLPSPIPSLFLPDPLLLTTSTPPIHSSSVPVQKGAGLPEVSKKRGKSSCGKTKHLTLYLGCARSCRRNRILRASQSIRAAPACIVKSPTDRPTYTTLTYMQRD